MSQPPPGLCFKPATSISITSVFFAKALMMPVAWRIPTRAGLWFEASCCQSCGLRWPASLVGAKMLQNKMWEGPCWEGVFPCLDPWACVRLRTASTYWNAPGKCVPHGELFFFLIKKEPVAVSNEVPCKPFLCGNAQGVCADWSTPIGSRR